MILGSPAPIDVQRELAAMRAELAEIRVAQREEWIDRERANQMRAVVADAMADSATRASFLSSDVTCGYDRGAYMRSADGCWSVKVNLLAQVRFVYNSASNQQGADNTWGMETHRVNAMLAGTMLDPSVSWMMMTDYNTQPDRFVEVVDEVVLLYAWVRKDMGSGFAVTVGLQNVPWDMESDYVGSCNITSGEFSIFNYRFGSGKQEGVTASYRGDWWRTTAGVFSQLNGFEQQWDSPTNLAAGLAMRTEAKIGAEWTDLDWEYSLREGQEGMVFGLGTLWSSGRAENSQEPDTPAAQGFTAALRGTAAGATLIAQYALMRDPVGQPELGWGSGVNVQGSVFVADGVQAFAEACWMDAVEVPWIAQCGVNWYVGGRVMKVTTRVVVPFGSGDVNGTRNIAGGLGIADSGNNASLVTQLQLLF